VGLLNNNSDSDRGLLAELKDQSQLGGYEGNNQGAKLKKASSLIMIVKFLDLKSTNCKNCTVNEIVRMLTTCSGE